METLYDMHCHLDFAEGSERIAQESKAGGVHALSCTVVPSSYVSDLEKFQGCENIRLSLGLHPWWVADGRVSEVDIAHFESLLPEALYVGEIGLDFAGARKQSKERQVEVLTRILEDIHQAGGGRVITFHAVHAATQLMDLLDAMDTLEENLCLFHWFQGSPEEFGRAISAGVMLSVGMRMLATEKGAAFAAAIPEEQLLVETDSPSHEGSDWSLEAWREEIENTMKALAEVRGLSQEAIAHGCDVRSELILKRA